MCVNSRKSDHTYRKRSFESLTSIFVCLRQNDISDTRKYFFWNPCDEKLIIPPVNDYNYPYRILCFIKILKMQSEKNALYPLFQSWSLKSLSYAKERFIRGFSWRTPTLWPLEDDISPLCFQNYPPVRITFMLTGLWVAQFVEHGLPLRILIYVEEISTDTKITIPYNEDPMSGCSDGFSKARPQSSVN